LYLLIAVYMSTSFIVATSGIAYLAAGVLIYVVWKVWRRA